MSACQPRLRADNGEMLRAAAEAGLGICILPSFIAAPAIESRQRSSCCCATIRSRKARSTR